MIYTVKSKKEFDDLIEILEEEGLSLTHEDKKIMTVEIKNEKEFDVFSNILSFYVSYLAFDEQLLQSFIKKGLTKKEAVKLKKESLFDITNSHYFFTLTRVLVREYFKKMQTFNIDSFVLFNMKGFKDEVKLFADTTLQYQNNPPQSEAPMPFEEDSVEIIGEGMKDLFITLRERGIESGLKLEDYKELHVFQQGQFLHFKNQKGVILDNDFFLEYVGSVLQFEVEEDVENPELLESIMTTSVIIYIFDVKKVVIHESLEENTKDILLYNINALKKETGKKIKVVMCNGCDQCK